MKKNNKIVISPNVSVALPSDTADIGTKRSQCNTELIDASWRMIYATDDADFDKQWNELTKKLDSFGFQDLYKFDVEKAQIEVDAKKTAQ
ncbi:MAG: hypothetical protein K6G45_05330 [Lachnospiraceae bacterium]|nr:hypothetical protein [Lachnospiraceae bacterium]